MTRVVHIIGAAFLLSSYAYCGLSRFNEHDIEGGDSYKRVKREFERLGSKWLGGTINYYYADNNNSVKEKVKSAIAYIANHTCIKFNEDPTHWQRLKIFTSELSHCRSTIGAPGTRSGSAGELSMETGWCANIGSIVHEFSHSLGRYHEHTRPDRDNSLKVTSTDYEARPRPWGMTTMYGPFEHGSIMMYHSSNYGVGKMEPYDMEYKNTMGSRRVTFYDMYKINQYYGCGCSTQLECKNGGYTSPSDCSRCNCPKGFFGKLCNERRQQDSYELKATYGRWQTQTISFNYKPEPVSDGFYSTFVYITGEANSTIEITMEGLENVICTAGCTWNGVEIKSREDSRITSPVMCCKDEPLYKKVFKSLHNPTIIELYSKETAPSTATFKYRFMNDKIVFG
ncbi:Zinc metalloproteinase nas-24 [Caenorhabditis elegans]|uniref:Zinc metalloproteinase nas-24 n=1 Tax=Caenorhabditis elegans TaxID=6239 RepID=NAS24_CAEEL|nr:Zinc metalloproteinase nas-24 [Caenorhabditis elegans]Q93542.2 RecName: Full=Zinc metalloproteinase nas-24; AltName: Full=Nematode astacin 24; Flags: Precursor [Caenorhabditis elegans]CAB02084.2 Zinc metalloproteinase nas-24 [Caenorhabditis elegans]|eukprot:NP_506409.2 Zinc metalloproteinase nas-24 [Caenorhabditis elegans]